MKILLISMPSVHVIRWVENLKDSGYQLYWFDVLNRGSDWLEEATESFTNWEKRKIPYIKGEYYLSKKWPKIYNRVLPFLKKTEDEALDEIISRVQPDVIHSFEMFSACLTVYKTMQKHSNIKWLYSCWGSDLYNIKKENHNKISPVLKRINALHTDCKRDYKLAIELGFKGKYVGVVPGGGGFPIETLERFKQKNSLRKIILVKGYQHSFGRALTVVKALELIRNKLTGWQVIFFGCHEKVINEIKKRNLPFTTFSRNELSHIEVLKLLGKSRVYVGNNISDGLPNTLLEAIVMEAFPIQSNPGGATAEIIEHGLNGYLIENSENPEEIQKWISFALKNDELILKAAKINKCIAKERLDYDLNKRKICNMYKII